MKINKLTVPLSLLVVAMFGACSTDALISEMGGEGTVQIVCSAEGFTHQSQTRAESNLDAEGNELNFKLPDELLPDFKDFKLNIRGEYYNSSLDGAAPMVCDTTWPTVESFNEKNPNGCKLEAGAYKREQSKYLNSYHAYVSYGNINEEGVGKPYFAGESVVGFTDDNGTFDKTPADFNIYPDEKKQVQVVARLANSCFSLEVLDWMLKYYSEIELKIHTSDVAATSNTEAVAGKVFTFRATATENDNANNIFAYTTPELKADDTHTPALIFVRPGQKLKLSGWAVKRQNQTGAANQKGVKVEFAEAEIGELLVADTHYTIKVDHDTAGSGGLTITFDDTITQIDPDDTGENGSEGDGTNELNPDGN